MKKASKWNKIMSIRTIIDEEICKPCEYSGLLCMNCYLKAELIKLEEKSSLSADASLEQVFNYCKRYKRKYDRLYELLKKHFSEEKKQNE